MCQESIKNKGDRTMNIISLTSHGKRLEVTAFRAVCTLLDQTTPADKVILWLNEDVPPLFYIVYKDWRSGSVSRTWDRTVN